MNVGDRVVMTTRIGNFKPTGTIESFDTWTTAIVRVRWDDASVSEVREQFLKPERFHVALTWPNGDRFDIHGLTPREIELLRRVMTALERKNARMYDLDIAWQPGKSPETHVEVEA